MRTPREEPRPLALRDLVRTIDTNRTGHVIALSAKHGTARVQFISTVEDEWISVALLEVITSDADANTDRYHDLADILPRLARAASWLLRAPAHARASVRCA